MLDIMFGLTLCSACDGIEYLSFGWEVITLLEESVQIFDGNGVTRLGSLSKNVLII